MMADPMFIIGYLVARDAWRDGEAAHRRRRYRRDGVSLLRLFLILLFDLFDGGYVAASSVLSAGRYLLLALSKHKAMFNQERLALLF